MGRAAHAARSKDSSPAQQDAASACIDSTPCWLYDKTNQTNLNAMLLYSLPWSLRTTLQPPQAVVAAVTLSNRTHWPLRAVAIKVDHTADRGATQALFDGSHSPLDVLLPGAWHEVRVAFDVTEPGAHSVACSAVFSGASPAPCARAHGLAHQSPCRCRSGQCARYVSLLQRLRTQHPRCRCRPTACVQRRAGSASTTCSSSSCRRRTRWRCAPRCGMRPPPGRQSWTLPPLLRLQAPATTVTLRLQPPPAVAV